MGRIGNSFRLFRQSYGVLMKDKELLVLPVISGVLVLIATVSFAIPLGVLEGELPEEESPLWWLVVLAFYVVTYTIGIYFQAAIIAGANERMSGGEPSLGSALAAPARHLGSILAWGFVAGTVGMILKAIQERSELLGRIVAGLLGAAWSLATFFVVPAIILEGKSVGEAFPRSWQLFKKTWGETVVANFGLGLAVFLLLLPILAICGLLAYVGLTIPAIVTAVLSIALLMVFASALQGVYVAALFRYARTGETSQDFDRDLLEGAYRAKKRK